MAQSVAQSPVPRRVAVWLRAFDQSSPTGIPARDDKEAIRPGGTVANIGVHGKSVELQLQDLWIKDIAITTGLVSATTTPMLLRLVAQGKLTPEMFVSHRFTFEAIIDAYDTFGRAAETKALKVAITR